MKAARALALCSVLATGALAGCLSGTDVQVDPSSAAPGETYDTSHGWSMPLVPGTLSVLDGVKTFVPSHDGVEMAIGIFRPDLPGCDWEASDLPEQCQLPTLMDAGPYYLDRVDQDKHRPPWVDWLVPRGYAVIQMSLRGTGESGGCMDYKAPGDVDDISAVIDWIAAQPWSNGNVGMGGRSYDGTAAWSGAASGNPNLRTIIPISGAVDAPDMYFRNGTAELRMLIPHAPIYWLPYGMGTAAGDPGYRADAWVGNVCPEVAEAHLEAGLSTVTGDASAGYWQERDLTGAILDGYQGSVWVIHGMEDWNVNPSQAVPFIRDMQGAGIPVLGWLGQWAHAYPDRLDEHRNVRWDWAQRVVEWLDFYLKDEGPQPVLGVEVEDSLYTWRLEATYPPADVNWTGFHLGWPGLLATQGASEGDTIVAGQGLPGSSATYASEALPMAVRVAGLPRLHVSVTPSSPHGGSLFAELYDVFPDGRAVRLGWAAMDIRYHEGGNTKPEELTPGEAVVAKMQFEPMDAHIAQGHRLLLVIHRDGVEDILPSTSAEPWLVHAGTDVSTLWLPVVDRPSLIVGAGAPGA